MLPRTFFRWSYFLSVLLGVGLTFAGAPAAQAQGQLGIYTFTGAAGNEVSFPVDAQPANASFSAIRRGSGVVAAAGADAFAGGSWHPDSMSVDTADYFAFRLTAGSGQRLNLDSLTFSERRSGTGIRKWQVRTSLDNFAAPVFTQSVPDNTLTRRANVGLTAAVFNTPLTVEFRIYGYGAEAAGGTWRLDNIRLVGQVIGGGPVVPTVSFGAAARLVTEGVGAITIPVSIANPSATAATTVQVALASSPGTATSGQDYTAFTTQTLTFPAGSSAPRNATLTIIDDSQTEFDETIVLQLQNPNVGATLGTPVTQTITIRDNDGAPLRTIASVTVNDPQGVPTSLGQQVRLRGVISGPNTRTVGYLVPLIDNTGGITLFSSFDINGGSVPMLPGDSVEVTGTITQFRGLTEVDLDTFALLIQNQPIVAPQVVTVLGEPTESELVKINGPLTIVDPAQWVNAGSGFNVDVTDGTTIYQMRIVSNTDIFGTPAPTQPFRLVGIGGQFDNAAPFFEGYQIAPRSLADIQIIGASTPTVQFGAATRTVTESAGTIQIPVTIATPSTTTATTVQVALATPAGTATSGTDYTFATQTLTFPAGSATTQNATFTVIDDVLDENTETVNLQLLNPSTGVQLGTPTAYTLTIVDNDTTILPTLSFGVATRTDSEGAGTVQVPVTILNPRATLATTVQVTLAATPGTATSGTDYTFATQTLTFPAGSATTQNATLTLTDDALTEGPETVILNLTSPSGGASVGQASFVLTIADNDTTKLRFGTATRTVAESSGTLQIPVTLTKPSPTTATTVQVVLAAAPGTATLGADYTFGPQTLTFPAGSTTAQNATLTIVNDLQVELPETAVLMLQNPSTGALLSAPTTFTLTITDNDTTVVRFGTATRSVAESVGTLQIPVTLTGPNQAVATTVEVAIATNPGTATSGSDYTFATQTLTFPAGSTTTQDATLTVTEDLIDEADETVFLTLRNPSTGVVIRSGSFALTILDNDTTLVPVPALAFGPVTVLPESIGTVQVPVTITNPDPTTATTVRVALAPSPGTATAGADYTFASQVLTFPAGSGATQTATLTVIDDTDDESDETILLQLDSASAGAVISAGSVALTIRDNDTTVVPPAVQLGAATLTVAESVGTVTVPVTITNASATTATTVQVRLAAVPGTATVGADYSFATQTLTFPAGSTTTQNATLTVVNDGRVERAETVMLVLDSVSAGAQLGALTQLTLTIQDDDTARVRFGATALTVAENVGSVTIPVRLSAPNDTAATAVQVTLAASAGTATLGADYTFASQTVIFQAGDTAQTATLTVTDDALVEAAETVVLALAGAPSQLTITINDNDTTRVAFGISVPTVVESIGTLQIPVTLTSPNDTAATRVRVTFATPPGTATAGQDYSFAPQFVTFPAGSTTPQFVTLTVTDDAISEVNETVILMLDSLTAGAYLAAPSQVLLTIQDNDTTRVQFSSLARTVAENAGTVQIPVNLTTASATPVTVYVGLSPFATATLGADYAIAPQTLTFPAGSTTQNVTLTVVDDTQTEGDETLVLIVDSASVGVGSLPNLTVTIVDNDTVTTLVPPLETIAAVTVVDAQGVPTRSTQAVRVRGIATSPNIRTAGYQLTLQDRTGGVTIFKSTTIGTQAIAQGDSLELVGVVTNFNGLTEIVIDSFRTLLTAQLLPTPRVVTVLDETTESELIKINGPLTIVNPSQWTGMGSGFNVDVTDGTTTYTMRVVRGTDVYSAPVPTQAFRLTGTGGQFDNATPFDQGYQITPRAMTDFDFIVGLEEASQASALALYPNPATDQLTVRASGATATVYDNLGRVVRTANLASGIATLDVRLLPAGVYVVQVGAARSRFVKQ